MRYSININTPIGNMIAIGDETHISSLNFSESPLENIKYTDALHLLEQELDLYFKKQLTIFKSKLVLEGTEFQNSVWQSLQNIPYSETRSYKEIASEIQHPKSVRAVANANSKNKILILIPCHRVIAHNGSLSGFAAGIKRKEWLLNHEKAF